MKDSNRSMIKYALNNNGYEMYKLSNQVKLRELKDSLINKQHEYKLLISRASRKRAEMSKIEKQIKNLMSG